MQNNDPITIPSLPPPLLIGVSDVRAPRRWRHMGTTQINVGITFSRKNQSTSWMSYDKKSGQPTTSFTGRPLRGSLLIKICFEIGVTSILI